MTTVVADTGDLVPLPPGAANATPPVTSAQKPLSLRFTSDWSTRPLPRQNGRLAQDVGRLGLATIFLAVLAGGEILRLIPGVVSYRG